VLAGAALRGDAYLLFGGGLLGAYTTFSTWMLDAHLLGEEGRRDLGALNIGATLALGLLAVWLGRHLGAAF
jgi:CrcB protein